MATISNTEMHTNEGVLADPFGDTGATRIVPIERDRNGRAFILDAPASRALAAELDRDRLATLTEIHALADEVSYGEAVEAYVGLANAVVAYLKGGTSADMLAAWNGR